MTNQAIADQVTPAPATSTPPTAAAPAPAAPAKAAETEAKAAPERAADVSPATVPPNPAAPATAAVSYDLKLPEGSPLDAASVEDVKGFASKHKLDAAAAQALLEQRSASAKAQADEFVATQTGWISAVESDAVLGGRNKALADLRVESALSVMQPEFRQRITDSKVVNEPGFRRFLHDIGALMGDSKMVVNGHPPGAKGLDVKTLFPKSHQQDPAFWGGAKE